MNTLIPNTYQKPNWYSDEIDYLLTPKESKVLDFLIRRILGFEDNRASRRDRVSVSQITDGIRRADGSYLSYGTGLSKPCAIAALKGLCDFGLLAKIGASTENGQEYELVSEVARINLDGLRARREAARDAGRVRTEKARASRTEGGKTDIPAVSQSDQRYVSLTAGGMSVLPQAVCQSDTQNPQSKPTIKTHERDCADKSAPTADEPVEPVVKPSRKREPKITEEERAYYAETVPALAEACHLDLSIDGVWAQCQKQLRALYNAQVRPTAALVAREYGQPTGYWYAQDWRGQKGQPPAPHDVTNTWGAATTFKAVKTNGHPRAAPNGYPPQEDGTAALRARYGAPATDDPLPPGVIEGRVKRVDAA